MLPQAFVSVIIPVYNNNQGLRRCLEALSVQTYEKSNYEVIVIDNNSDVSPENITAAYSNVSLVHEPRRGSYCARNKGIALSSGDVLAFTDADCLPHETWLEKGVQCLFETNNCGLVAGKVELEASKQARPSPYEKYDQLTYLNQQTAVRRGRYGATANLFTHRNVFETVGHFDAELVSGGDNEWGKRVYQHGYRQAYCAGAVVRHPARNSFTELLKKELRLAGGLVQVDRRQEDEHSSSPTLSISDRLQVGLQPVRNAMGVLLGSTSEEIPTLGERLHLGGIILTMHVVRRVEQWRIRWGGDPVNL